MFVGIYRVSESFPWVSERCVGFRPSTVSPQNPKVTCLDPRAPNGLAGHENFAPRRCGDLLEGAHGAKEGTLLLAGLGRTRLGRKEVNERTNGGCLLDFCVGRRVKMVAPVKNGFPSEEGLDRLGG